jgi:dephospho-CoA kinase
VTTVIGLTGGIASGKSVVSRMLAERGALVIDADKVGHEAYAKGSDCYRAVIDAFGADIVAPDGEIDRKALGGKVFGDPAQRKRLEGIVWPWMRSTMDGRLQKLREERVPPEMARERIMSRNALTAEQAEQRIAAQLTNDERAEHAHVIIDNSGTLEDLERHVTAEWEKLAAAAGRNA